ncbi:hypothetical protein PENTCL1PPCAC_11676, partial [Pristionchus entomophagus]
VVKVACSMSLDTPSLLDDDSEGFSGEDSVRELSGYRKPRKEYLSPKDIRYEPGQVRKTITQHLIYSDQETPMRKISRYASDRLTPVKSRFRQCKALIRPLHSRYYPFCVAFYILLAGVASCYFFGATPGIVTETVLEPMVDAVTGMKDKMEGAYLGVRDSVGDAYSGVKDRIKDAMDELDKKSKESRREGISEAMKIEKEEMERRIEEMVRKEMERISSEMKRMKNSQDANVEWMNELKEKNERESDSFQNRLNSFGDSIHDLKLDLEEKMRSIPNGTESTSTKPHVNDIALQEIRMHLEDTKKEVKELRRLIPVEEKEELENLASYINGATIIDSVTSKSLYSTVFNLFFADRAPLFLLTERQLHPGDCMPLPANGGSVGIRLSVLGHISHMEYYHLYWSEAGGIPLSAPKDINVMGCTDDAASLNCETIAQCEYTVENTVMRREEAKRRRIFGIPIECPVKEEMKSGVTKSIRVDILSNHGGEHTCLYLLRVLGKAA